MTFSRVCKDMLSFYVPKSLGERKEIIWHFYHCQTAGTGLYVKTFELDRGFLQFGLILCEFPFGKVCFNLFLSLSIYIYANGYVSK